MKKCRICHELFEDIIEDFLYPDMCDFCRLNYIENMDDNYL